MIPVKRWMPARQRPLDVHQRLPALVQLAAADEHGADLGQLAGLAGEPVGLGVDDEELGVASGCRRIHSRPVLRRVPTDCNARVRAIRRVPADTGE